MLAADPEIRSTTDIQTRAVLMIDQQTLDVRYASPRAVTWLGLSVDRLLGRSLLFSVPALGQSLTVAIAGGLGPEPVALNAIIPIGATQDHDHSRAIPYAQWRTGDILVELRPDPGSTTRDPTPGGTALESLRRLDEIQQDLIALRARLRSNDHLLQQDEPLLLWLWQAQTALAQVRERYPTLSAQSRRAANG